MPSLYIQSIRPADATDLGMIRQLLTDSRLPTDDLLSSPIDFLISTDEDENLIGCIGVELYGADGFLRSFAVKETWRKQGIGKNLLNQLNEYALIKGVTKLHLLTTTAQSFFEQNGFIRSDRTDAPMSIQNTTEFKGMCCSTAAYLVQSIA
jgi:amino-acid N-acetyltransferase